MEQSSIPYILSTLTFLPLLGAIVVMLLRRPQDLPDSHGADHGDAHGHAEAPGGASAADTGRVMVNGVALFFSLATFLLSLALFAAFNSRPDPVHRNMQFMEDFSWITTGGLNIHYRMGVDGISLLLVVLTTFLMVLSVLYSFTVKQRLKEFMVFLLLLETGMIGVFCALDLVLFYVFWEAMLIPMYFLIGIFGHENRIYAAIKFFLYTFAGSIFMLVAIIGVYRATGTFDIASLGDPRSMAYLKLHQLASPLLMWMFAAFALAFMIKVPMFPFHTWLPDAHVEAPTAGSVILAGVMLKMGTYGFLRLCIPLFPEQAQSAAPIFITLAIIGIIYGSIVAAVQPDAKKLVAYSSVAHLGFVILGIFTFTRVGMMGALLQNINHGISTPMLFFLVGMLYDRRHTRLITEFGGLKKIVPMLSTMLLLATLASVAVPFFNGFVGEFPILVGSWISTNTGFGATALAATGMILSAVYMLWWFQRLMLGKVTNPVNLHLRDLTRNEWLVLTPLAAMVFWIGLNSTFWSDRMQSTVDTLMANRSEPINTDLPIAEILSRESFRTDRAGRSALLQISSPRRYLQAHPEAYRNALGAGAAARGGRPGGPGGGARPGGGGPPPRRGGSPGPGPGNTPPPGRVEPPQGGPPPGPDAANRTGAPANRKPSTPGAAAPAGR